MNDYSVNDIKNVIAHFSKIQINNKPIKLFWRCGNQYIYHFFEFELGRIIYLKLFDKSNYKKSQFNLKYFFYFSKNIITIILSFFYLLLLKKKNNQTLLASDYDKHMNEIENIIKKKKINYDKVCWGILARENYFSIPQFDFISFRKLKVTNVDSEIYKHLSSQDITEIIYFLDKLYLKIKIQYIFSKIILKKFNYKLFITWDQVTNNVGLLIALKEKKVKIMFIQHIIFNDKVPLFINENIENKYKDKLSDYYYVWGDNFKNLLIRYNKNFSHVTFPNKEDAIKSARYFLKKNKNKILYFFENLSDLKNMNLILKKIQAMSFDIIIKIREKNNEKIDILLDGLNKKKYILKKNVSEEDLNEISFIICSRTSAFYKYLINGETIIGIKTNYYLLEEFEKDSMIISFNCSDFLKLDKRKILDKIENFQNNNSPKYEYYNLEKFFNKIYSSIFV
tara:strand:+ start:1952 stop:3307 length:1356 start_codon:yes stop_codon:yes gene_type:complete